MNFERYSGNPILSPNPANEWENLVTTNAGVWHDEESGKVYMLYRAAGDDFEHRIHLGLAVSEDGFNFERTSDQPVFSPIDDNFDGGCAEDPRIMKIGDWYYITYAYRPFPPRQYWLPENYPYYIPPSPEEFPISMKQSLTGTGLLMTKDFKKFLRAGRVTSPLVDDRDVYFLPEKVQGKWWMIHRPMQWAGEGYDTEYPTMWIASGDDMLDCRESQILITAKYDWETKIGGNTTPLKTEHGWLTLYHAVGRDKLYRVGALLLDLEDPRIVRHRTPNWLMQPETPYENEGYYEGVVFPCGKFVKDGKLFVYYGGGDKHVCLATCDFAELMDHLVACPA